MTLREFVRTEKVLVEGGSWSDKRMPRTGGKFPLSRARNFRVGAPGWRWRVVQLEAWGRLHRVLVMYHAGKQNLVAAVGTHVGGDLLILGVLEHHSTHPGWHVHAGCETPTMAEAGRLRYPGMRRVAAGDRSNAQRPFPAGDEAVIETVSRYLRLPRLPSEGAVQVPMNFPPGAMS